ncbi:PadR family transcriptional regulator [Salinibacterium sp. M195]|uniref:PadR family transcriptional regulator n=1 Tax=Salinibacterium sp. M195 TaxID=2583374 RepID=UPI001C636B43|nr:PadR family transcriptional regulator [Salinibacterium sp. M195]QYH36670.1 helix-turn-helix transcriptional regulator [Salinibacterium sp. M195]
MEPLSRITAATLDVIEALTSAPNPLWGLRIVKSTGRPAGSVYPILERLERLGWVTSQWEDDSKRSGPRRRLYELTSDGAASAPALISSQRAIADPSTTPRGTSAVRSFGASA